MITRNYSELIDEMVKDKIPDIRQYGHIRGRALSYHLYTRGKKHPEPMAFEPGCFDWYIKQNLLIPIVRDHDMNKRVGYVEEVYSSNHELTFLGRIYDIRVYHDPRDKFEFSVGFQNDDSDTIKTTQGILVTKAILSEITILSLGNRPADPYAIEL